MILVDTSVLIGFFKGEENGPCREFERVLRQEIPFGINSLIFQEVLQGAGSSFFTTYYSPFTIFPCASSESDPSRASGR